jgi:thiamine biosynthesis protein ThiC
MINITLSIDAPSYQQHIEEQEATDAEVAEKLREDAIRALRTYPDMQSLAKAIRLNRSITVGCVLYDDYIDKEAV